MCHITCRGDTCYDVCATWVPQIIGAVPGIQHGESRVTTDGKYSPNVAMSIDCIETQIDQIWAWLSRGHRWSPGVRNPLKSSVTGPSLLVNCYLEIKFHKIIRVNPPPPPPPLTSPRISTLPL